MVTLLIIASVILVLIGIGIYFWQKPVSINREDVWLSPPEARSLFADDDSKVAKDQKRLSAAELTNSFVSRAKTGDHAALAEAHSSADKVMYDRVLTELVQISNSNPKLLALMSYVSRHELPVNQSLARVVIASWRKAPDRGGTAKALHFAALSDDADIYRETVEEALTLWREGKVPDISPRELRALFEGEFWILCARTRSSGAGFVLKRTLESARRDLEAAGASP
jgi:hypothetical protein